MGVLIIHVIWWFENGLFCIYLFHIIFMGTSVCVSQYTPFSCIQIYKSRGQVLVPAFCVVCMCLCVCLDVFFCLDIK